MLEQPPERDYSEILAEAAAAPRQINPVHWIIRLTLWLLPCICSVGIFMGFTYAFGVFFAQEHPYYYTPAVFFLFVFMSSSFVNFGIGYIDAHLSTEVRMECDGKSKKDLLAHATTFMILQYLIIPVIAVLVVIVMLVNFLYRMLQSN